VEESEPKRYFSHDEEVADSPHGHQMLVNGHEQNQKKVHSAGEGLLCIREKGRRGKKTVPEGGIKKHPQKKPGKKKQQRFKRSRPKSAGD